MTTITPYRSTARNPRDGFGPLLRAEWTKFRTVRGWIIGMFIAIIVTAGLGALVAQASTNVSCTQSGGGQATVKHGAACGASRQRLLGPGGEPVDDQFYFVRQPLDGNGSLTVKLTSLAGLVQPNSGGPEPRGQAFLDPWSKAGIIIKDGTRQGSAYAAMMATGGNGVRMQWDYTRDTAGLPGAVSAANPRWLRLTRTGDTLTGYDSGDGTHWTQVGTVRLNGLPSTVQAGLFVTSPDHTTVSTSFANGNVNGASTWATAAFTDVSRTGTWPTGGWTGDFIGGGGAPLAHSVAGYHQAGGQFTVTGTGDIAPVVSGPGSNAGPDTTISDFLLGTFVGLIVVAVIAAMFMTAEYRRGLIRTTLVASPGRGRVLAAKAIVIGLAAFVTGTAAAAATVFVATHIAHSNGFVTWPEPWPTELRIIVGTGLLVAAAAVFTLAVATMVRRSAATLMITIVVLVVPYFLARTAAVPLSVANWLLRITPAAGFALQQATPQFHQVQSVYSPFTGFYPLLPWAGFAVLCGWTVLALAGAAYSLRRRDA
ncbi:MAG TPA: ABC transporter permease subunit [Trebonia sp.]|jgi:ABC-type transport system involved in multi-copper enzyme maturation permease subunit|nr:ABC transporter permease subunit [Trebonia sp.]